MWALELYVIHLSNLYLVQHVFTNNNNNQFIYSSISAAESKISLWNNVIEVDKNKI